MNRQQKRRIKNLFIAISLAVGLTLFVKHQMGTRVPRAASDGINDMLNLAKKAAIKRQQSAPMVHLKTEDFDIPDDPELARVDKILKEAEAFRNAKSAAAEEAPKKETVRESASDSELKLALEKIGELLVNNGLKLEELQSNIDNMSKRLRAQEDLSIELESLMKSRLMFVAEKQEQILKQTTAITNQNQVPFFKVAKFAEPPISTITCFGNSTTERVCKVKNLCYDPPTDKFFIFKDTNSLEINTPKNRSYLVDTTSIDGHNRFYFDYQEVHPDRYEQRSVRLVEKLTFMISRFHTYNIMHTVHDDFIGLYLLHRMFAPNTDEDPAYSFTQDNNIFFVDSWKNLRYDYIFQLLTKNPIQFRELYRTEASQMPICFRDAIVGNSKEGSWYTYGFLEPQGPIPNKTVPGLMIREVASYLIKRFHLPTWNENAIRGIIGDLSSIVNDRKKNGGNRDILHRGLSDHHFITIFSRKLDRLILNEDELAKTLTKYYGLEVRYVRIEDMHLMEQISILKNTVIALGMHGSALILSMFLPPGALLIEFFPYRVPADNYTPYKTLCSLPGIRLAYRSWTNTHEENNFPHPEKPANGGGIKHLPDEEQVKILNNPTVPPHLCCSDPTWLFRIYQDTKVHIGEVMDLIDDGLQDSAKMANVDPGDYVYIRPASIENVYCKVENNSKKADQLDLHISWTKPWNGVKPDFYGIWVHQNYQELNTDGPETNLVMTNCTPDSEYDLWVRPYMIDPLTKEVFRGAYSDKFTCICNHNTTAVRTKMAH